MCADVVGDEKLVYFLTQRFANIVCTGTLHDRCTSLAHQDTSLHPALKTFWPLVLERLISAGLALEAHPDVLDKLDQLPFDTALSLSRDVLHGKFKAEDSKEEAEETARAAGVEDSSWWPRAIWCGASMHSSLGAPRAAMRPLAGTAIRLPLVAWPGVEPPENSIRLTPLLGKHLQ